MTQRADLNSPGQSSPQQPAAAPSPNPAAPAVPNTTLAERVTAAQHRGHQSLGRVGDFWALVAMASSIDSTKAVLGDLLDAKLTVEAALRDLRQESASTELERASLTAAQSALADQRSHWEGEHAKIRCDLANRVAAVDQREDDCLARERAIETRENGVTAREAKMDKDNAAAAAQIVKDRAELQEMADQLSIRKADIDARSAALDKRLAAAKQFLSLGEPDPSELKMAPGTHDITGSIADTSDGAADVGRLDASANTG